MDSKSPLATLVVQSGIERERRGKPQRHNGYAEVATISLTKTKKGRKDDDTIRVVAQSHFLRRWMSN
jgi:hypothetical protein